MNASASVLPSNTALLPQFSVARDYALDCDAADILAPYRRQFELPRGKTGEPLVYMCGHSLGLAPKAALDYVSEELAEWAALGVAGHHTATRPWIDYAQNFTKGLVHVTGALPSEVVVMNSLTVNLHLMMASFYRPVGVRDKVLIEAGAFSSDRHAILGQIDWHKLEAEDTLIELAPAMARKRFDSRTSKRKSATSTANSRSCSGRACSTARARPLTAPPSRELYTMSGPWPVSTWRTPSAICRCRCMTGMSISPCGARTNI
jgi:hypothetical protein